MNSNVKKMSIGTVVVAIPSILVAIVQLSKEAREWATVLRSEPSAVTIDTVYLPKENSTNVKLVKDGPAEK